MTDAKANLWAKSWRKHWIDEKSVGLDMCAMLLRQFLAQHVDPTSVGEDGTGWATTETGKPWPLARLAAACRATVEQIEVALADLRDADVIVERDGVWGTLGWRDTQETPEAKRAREYRDRERARRPVTSTGHVTPPVTRERDDPRDSVTPSVTDQRDEIRSKHTRRAEEQKSRLTTLSPSAGVREDVSPAAEDTDARVHPAPSNPTADQAIGQRLKHARELVGTYTQATAAARAEMPLGRLKHIEAGVLLPTREDLLRLSRAYGQPEIASWPLPVRDGDLVTEIVAMHRDRAVELGAMAPGSPATATPLLAADVYASEAADLATGLTLRQAWTLVISRAAEELRREIARGRMNGRAFFTLRSLGGSERRAKYLALADLDRRDDGQGARASPPRRRGPAPPQNHDRLTDGEIPQ